VSGLPASVPAAQAVAVQPGPPGPAVAADAGGRRPSLLRRLLSEPSRFSFDAAVAVLMRAGRQAGPDAIRYRAPPGLGFVPSDVLSVQPGAKGFSVVTGLLGLAGPAGVLPRPYSEAVNAAQRRHSPALAAFLDMLAQRLVSAFAGAAIKYRPHRAAAASLGDPASRPDDGLRGSLLGLTGYQPERLLERLPLGADPLLFYAGAFAARPRAADRLAAILSDWLGQPVEVEQFVGSWLELGYDQMSALPAAGRAGQFTQLGVDAAIGSRAWDIQSRIMLRIGPLELDQFQSLLPGQNLLRRLASLVHAYLDGETGFVMNPVLAAHAVPRPALGPASPCLLGWVGWLPVSGGRRGDATDAVFTASGGQAGMDDPA